MLNFWAKFAQKEYFRSQKLKVNITIELSQFQLVSALYFSWYSFHFFNKLVQKRYFWSNTEKMNNNIEFKLFALFYVQSFILNGHFLFGP